MNIELFPIKPDKPFSNALVQYFAGFPDESIQECKENGLFSFLRPYDSDELLIAIEKEKQLRAKENEIYGDYRLYRLNKQNKNV